MTIVAELRAAGAAALQLPAALSRRGCQARHLVADDNVRRPVVMVHGYAGSETVWTPLMRALLDAGFGHLVSISYNTFATRPETVAAQVAAAAKEALRSSGADRINLIGHSLGGLIVRHAVDHGGLASLTATAVTIACPHRGAPLARIAPGRCSRFMLAPTPAPTLAIAPTSPVRWLTYYSDGDRVVSASSARLDEPRRQATNVLIRGCGHLTICRDARLIRSVVNELTDTESSRAPALRLLAPCPALAA